MDPRHLGPPIRARLPLLSALLLSTAGCGDPSDDTGGASPDGEGTSSSELCDLGYDLTWENWGASFFATYCDACHAASSPNRFDAPETVTFDTLEEVRSQKEVIAYAVLEAESMPLGGGVYEEDLYLLEIYLTCSL